MYMAIFRSYVTHIIHLYELNQKWYISCYLRVFCWKCGSVYQENVKIIHNYRYMGWFISIQIDVYSALECHVNHIFMFTTKQSILYIHIQHISKIPPKQRTLNKHRLSLQSFSFFILKFNFNLKIKYVYVYERKVA